MNSEAGKENLIDKNITEEDVPLSKAPNVRMKLKLIAKLYNSQR